MLKLLVSSIGIKAGHTDFDIRRSLVIDLLSPACIFSSVELQCHQFAWSLLFLWGILFLMQHATHVAIQALASGIEFRAHRIVAIFTLIQETTGSIFLITTCVFCYACYAQSGSSFPNGTL